MAAVESFESGLDRRLFPDPNRDLSNRAGWFSAAERQVAEALAARVMPSDADGPGAREAGVADALDRRLLAESPERRAFYGRGLAGLERASRGRFGRSFAGLSDTDQDRLLEELSGVAETRFRGPFTSRIPRRLTVLYYRWRFPAVDFFAQFVDDVFEAFYTSPVAWGWLGYDGPPMPLGYLDPTRPRI